MRRTVRPHGDREEGAVLIIVAIALVVLVGITALAIDGSYGFVQNRRAQNATDFAAFAASQQLVSSEFCDGTEQPSTAQIAAIVDEMVQRNVGTGVNWTAEFLAKNGQPILKGNGQPYAFTTSNDSGSPPPGACGVTVSANPVWDPFFAGILGIHKLAGTASGSVSQSSKGNPIGIVALNKVGPHEILGGGTGTFIVSGDIIVNSDVTKQPWTSSSAGWEWDDAIDAKSDSDLYVYGTIHTISGTYNNEPLWPLDTCFQGAGIVGKGNPTTASPAYQSGDPGAQLPAYNPACTEGSVQLGYDAIDPTISQIEDPLSGSGAPPDPLSASSVACPGMNLQTITSVSPSATVLLPGEYTNPVVLTGSATFEDCSGYPGEGAYPGIYRFDQGLYIDPQSSTDTVSGSNIVISTKNPYPLAGNVPGTLSGSTFTATGAGNGAPCLPPGTLTSAASGWGTPMAEDSATACSGTNNSLYGVVAYHDTPVPSVDSGLTGTGNNFSLIIGGASGAQVSLTGPTTGPYAGTDGTPGMVLYQEPTTQANYGFNAESGDAATITITGVVYNASLSSYGANAPQDYWDGNGGGIPFYAGGTLQTGFGAGWAAGSGPAQSGGSFTINGTAIVDDFNTDGGTTITILGQPYTLPGGGGLSLIG
ncbi:MAG TPA: pilus assembly protein TadG-related protein [Acidimicrobiales bacterium]|nr:pilus assembly protein TadG-related protein [Acidimicrobiales bacterium]